MENCLFKREKEIQLFLCILWFSERLSSPRNVRKRSNWKFSKECSVRPVQTELIIGKLTKQIKKLHNSVKNAFLFRLFIPSNPPPLIARLLFYIFRCRRRSRWGFALRCASAHHVGLPTLFRKFYSSDTTIVGSLRQVERFPSLHEAQSCNSVLDHSAQSQKNIISLQGPYSWGPIPETMTLDVACDIPL